MKKKRMLPKELLETNEMHEKLSDLQHNIKSAPVAGDDNEQEPSAYKVLSLKSGDKVSNESETKPKKVTKNAVGTKKHAKVESVQKNRGGANGNLLVTGDDKTLSNDACESSEKNLEVAELNGVGKAANLTLKNSGKKSKRKRHLTDEGKLSTPDKMQKVEKSDSNVFHLLLKRNADPKEVSRLKKAQRSGKKIKIKRKKLQKIAADGETVEHLEEDNEQQKNTVNDTIEKGENTNEKKESEVTGSARVWATFRGDAEKEPEEGKDLGSFIRCRRTVKHKSVENMTIDFEKKPFSTSDDSVQNAVDGFQWLISPYNMKRFFKLVYQKRAFCVCRNDSNYYGNLFSTAKFIRILRENYVEYGTNVNVAVYKENQRSTLNGSGRVFPQDIQRSIQTGCSIQFTNPQSFCDNAWYYCDLLQELFGCFVGANTYMTPANTTGFAPHWDDIDAFLLQLEGRKHWKVYAPIDEKEMLPRLPSENFTDGDLAERTPIFDGWLEQGDLLYIPRGFIHKGIADKDIHSLHFTLSVSRNIAYADLMERIIPPAITEFAEQNVEMRKSLPIGYLDMGGVLEYKYSLVGTGRVKLHGALNNGFSQFCNFVKKLNESAVDMMAREFMKTALPPVLTEEEKDLSAFCIAGSSLYDNKEHVFTKDTLVKLLRKHGQRLIYESDESCFIVHRMANSRVYEERQEVLFDLDVELVKGYVSLLNSYPKWCLVSDLKCNTAADNIKLVELLYNNGLLMAKFGTVMK